MLNELYSMYRGLEKIGESLEVRHNDIQSPGMGTTFRVLLDETGCVVNIEWMSKEQIKNTWSLGNGNKNQFPAIKLVYPLIPNVYKLYKKWKDENKKSDIKENKIYIKELINEYPVDLGSMTCWPDYRNKILERKEQLKEMEEGDAKCIYQLFENYSLSKNGKSILEQVADLLINLIHDADKNRLKVITDALFGYSVDNKGKVKDTYRVTLLLDLIPSEVVDIYASSRDWVSSISNALEKSESSTNTTSICALTGEVTEIVKSTFPKEKLEVIGNTILFAKSSNTSGPTVKRYDRSEADAYSVSKELSQKLAASIAFLSSAKLKEKTWSKIPSSTGASPSLLLAYCRDDLNLGITQLLTGYSDIEDFDDYKDATETVLSLYKNRDYSTDPIVDIAEIIVLDKANRKINFSTTSTLKKITLAANEWISACNNTPNFKLEAKMGKNMNFLSPWSLSPSFCVDISRNIFRKDSFSIIEVMLNKNGRKVKPPPSISFSDMIKLFLLNNSYSKQLAKRCLAKLSSQYEPLINHCALSKVQSTLIKKRAHVKTDPKSNTQALNAVTLLAVLLYKIGRKKEIYMNSFAYQLGQLCSAMDELHIGYCKSVRGGQIPNALIGNLTYGMALQNPNKALDVLATRIRPYEAWAKKQLTNNKENYSDDKAIKAGIFAYKWLSEQSKILITYFSEETKKQNDSYKAELMLGYLAGRPFEGKAKTNSDNTQGDK